MRILKATRAALRRQWQTPRGREVIVSWIVLAAWQPAGWWAAAVHWDLPLPAAFALGVVLGLAGCGIGRYAGTIRQAELDDQAASDATRDTIRRLERGEG